MPIADLGEWHHGPMQAVILGLRAEDPDFFAMYWILGIGGGKAIDPANRSPAGTPRMTARELHPHLPDMP